MKFHRYLKEKWVNVATTKWGPSDIFLNPNRKDWSEMNLKWGFRFIADMQDKKVWVWSEGGIHADVMDATNITPFSYAQYLKGVGADRWFAGLQNPDGSIESDTWDGILWKAQRGKTPDLVKDIMTMRKRDTTWLKKFNINSKNVDEKLNDSRYDV